MEIKISTLIMNWINFGIIILILRHFFWNKIKGIIEERQNLIDQKISKADEDAEKARMYLVKNEQILQSAKEEGKKITEGQREKGDKLYAEIVQNAKTEANSLKERASLEIEREKEKAEYEIKKQAVDLAIELSVKALGQQIDEDTHRKLIGDFIAKVGM
ncbi:F0F1 ATP synthase subunit B [Clostridium chromiireducens]|uniref:ATP synthase subunit b n=1 Tax=Clostridium chromiireducens TaxID=225345 RepID=A0A1V4IXE9_9CLOT|nr:F0F1 ATP synthase subunit B [Clostridium chromiireducens]MVX63881.1 F0F1 ATP synthase subunit B [Clostridium chromiireducens]OPJ64077.1 ATP synthase subunit b [Clostridium chromiireducens]RII32422.1 F0F1 ATP synthase subunit B [Clostridium chromiireducens]